MGVALKPGGLCKIKTNALNHNVVHFDPKLPCVILQMLALMGHIIDNERPGLFASIALTSSEQNYLQLERDALAITFGVKYFHKYFYGRKFLFKTDHQPLKTIFSPDKAVGNNIVGLHLPNSVLQGELVWGQQKGTSMGTADAMSHLPAPSPVGVDEVQAFAASLDFLPITHLEIARETQREDVLAKLLSFVKFGLPIHISDVTLKQYFIQRTLLSTENSCVLFGKNFHTM
ncbi:hypothetical protein PR048_006654 [Dryococelus australis]|uniref:Reverse transcriptase RNase H-like domain-containing protein n=1 Tax=Dryococelus australis TaxID=614101 RepID=A0ABQ9IBJ7_9NEOP|nr:hypothetical protein PR048_006654 [Dryococelus australis]